MLERTEQKQHLRGEHEEQYPHERHDRAAEPERHPGGVGRGPWLPGAQVLTHQGGGRGGERQPAHVPEPLAADGGPVGRGRHIAQGGHQRQEPELAQAERQGVHPGRDAYPQEPINERQVRGQERPPQV